VIEGDGYHADTIAFQRTQAALEIGQIARTRKELLGRLVQPAVASEPAENATPVSHLALTIISAARSAMTMVGALVLPLVIVGMVEASATRRFVVP
jgi:hypothetical protein